MDDDSAARETVEDTVVFLNNTRRWLESAGKEEVLTSAGELRALIERLEQRAEAAAHYPDYEGKPYTNGELTIMAIGCLDLARGLLEERFTEQRGVLLVRGLLGEVSNTLIGAERFVERVRGGEHLDPEWLRIAYKVLAGFLNHLGVEKEGDGLELEKLAFGIRASNVLADLLCLLTAEEAHAQAMEILDNSFVRDVVPELSSFLTTAAKVVAACADHPQEAQLGQLVRLLQQLRQYISELPSYEVAGLEPQSALFNRVEQLQLRLAGRGATLPS